MNLLSDSPTEQISDELFVKREDLCCPEPGPPFSKMRGVIKGLINLKKSGVKRVCYMESRISMASWGLSWAAKEIGGIEVIVFVPKYKQGTPPLLDFHRSKWESFGGQTYWLENPTRPSIMWHKIKKIVAKEFPGSFLIPVGMPFQETLEETCEQVKKMVLNWSFKSVVMSVGSGIITAGVLRGIRTINANTIVYGVSCKYHKLPIKKKLEIINRSMTINLGRFKLPTNKFVFINLNTSYGQPGLGTPPFPCNPFYDLKAWDWLVANRDELESPILFWNIGGKFDYSAY
jgi:1-aminocyclopropane-1-carboxylate deaminase/D-cysteine desulfhydrase-like pyridoxal-dependent ACC family enzyme